ncbi:hypothetical protein D1AOALGA4SA_1809 [Olavius algarvensis Delta 1 endosymbiont]|nr:hypothetical protein D1AOALGA4SA_1809 [Olavius algarvensis Delta 1 endosymbiont]
MWIPPAPAPAQQVDQTIVRAVFTPARIESLSYRSLKLNSGYFSGKKILDRMQYL